MACGGKRSDFNELPFKSKVFIDDPRLRTRNHQRELQSLTGFFQSVSGWMRDSAAEHEYLCMAEFDHLPLVSDLNARQIALAESERADVLGHHLARIDQTNHPHYLHHACRPEFHEFFARLSCRAERQTVLSMLGTGSFWRAEAFLAVAAVEESVPMYFELYIPTVAHHLGFRLRDYGEQNRFVSALGERSAEIDAARQRGGWTLHPVKHFPSALWKDEHK